MVTRRISLAKNCKQRRKDHPPCKEGQPEDNEYRSARRQAIFVVGPPAFANRIVLVSLDLDAPGPIGDRGVIVGPRRTSRAKLGLYTAARLEP
jgi:hypothetical protein